MRAGGRLACGGGAVGGGARAGHLPARAGPPSAPPPGAAPSCTRSLRPWWSSPRGPGAPATRLISVSRAGRARHLRRHQAHRRAGGPPVSRKALAAAGAATYKMPGQPSSRVQALLAMLTGPRPGTCRPQPGPAVSPAWSCPGGRGWCPPAARPGPRPKPLASATRPDGPTTASAACSSTWPPPSPATRSGSPAPASPCPCWPSRPASSGRPSSSSAPRSHSP